MSMVTLLVVGALAFVGYKFVLKQDNKANLLTGRVPDANITNNYPVAPPNQSDKSRPGPAQVFMQPDTVFTAPPQRKLLTEIVNFTPQPPTNTVQVSPALSPKISSLFAPNTSVVAPATANTNKTSVITEIKPPVAFKPPTNTGAGSSTVKPTSGGLFSTVVPPTTVKPSLSTSILKATGLVTTGKSRF